jgi:hypothetical protein
MELTELVVVSGLVFSSGFAAGYYVRERISQRRREQSRYAGQFE